MTFLEELDDDLLELCTGGFGGSYGDSGGGGGDFGGFGGGDFGGFGGGDSGGFGDFGSGGDFGLGDFGLGGDFGFGLGDTGLGIGGDSGDVSLGEVGADLGGDAPASDIGGDTAVEASGDPVGEPASSSEPTADLSVSADAGPDADVQGPEAFAEPVDTNADPNGAAAQQESVEPAMPDAMSDEPAIVVSESAETAEADAAEVTAQEVVMADAVSDPPVTTDPQTPDDPMFANEDHAPVTQREPDVVGPEGLEAAPPNDAALPTDVDPAPHVTDGVLPHFGQTGAGPEVSANSPQTSGEPPKPVEPPLPLTPEEQYEVDVYKTQNPVDVLEQGNVGDCYAVAVLRELGDTPEGRAYMDSLVQDLGDGFYQVTLVGPDGQAQVQTVWLHEGEKFGNGDPKVMALEKAIVYNQQSASGIEGMNGGQVTDAMNQLGLQNPTYGPPSDALNVGIQNQVITVQTGDVGPLPYGLVSNHAYTVVGTAVDPSGTLMVLLSNPWGDGHPLPIPADLLGTAVTGATTGQIVWPDP